MKMSNYNQETVNIEKLKKVEQKIKMEIEELNDRLDSLEIEVDELEQNEETNNQANFSQIISKLDNLTSLLTNNTENPPIIPEIGKKKLIGIYL